LQGLTLQLLTVEWFLLQDRDKLTVSVALVRGQGVDPGRAQEPHKINRGTQKLHKLHSFNRLTIFKWTHLLGSCVTARRKAPGGPAAKVCRYCYIYSLSGVCCGAGGEGQVRQGKVTTLID